MGNFNTFLGAFAAQSTSLTAAIALLPGTFQNASRAFTNFNAATPAIRKFSLALVPGVRTDSLDDRGSLPLDRTDTGLACPDGARRRRQGSARSGPDARRAGRDSARLLQTDRPLLQVSEHDLLPGRQHQAAGRLEHLRRGSLQGILVLRWWVPRASRKASTATGRRRRFLVETGSTHVALGAGQRCRRPKRRKACGC